jgi:hypothetical protein
VKDMSTKRSTTAQLPPYRPDGRCSKCGYEDISTQYVEPDRPYAYGCRFHKTTNDEHLHRYCRRCGYEWAEACIEQEM